MNNVINNQEDNIDGKRDVFISYKRENAPFVTRLYEELDRHDISAWVDLSKLHKEVGEEYQEKIRKAIDSAEYFLLIYTEHKGCSIEKSDFIINNELEYALEKRKKVLFYPQDPINLTTSRIRPYVEKIQWIDTAETARYQLDTQEAVGDEKRLAKLSEQINKKDGFSVFEDENVFLIRVALQRILGKITILVTIRNCVVLALTSFMKRISWIFASSINRCSSLYQKSRERNLRHLSSLGRTRFKKWKITSTRLNLTIRS